MTDPELVVAMASVGTLTVAVTSAAAFRGWQAWLDLKRSQLGRGRPASSRAPTSTRVEIATLRERIRRLEAIANGTDH